MKEWKKERGRERRKRGRTIKGEERRRNREGEAGGSGEEGKGRRKTERLTDGFKRFEST